MTSICCVGFASLDVVCDELNDWAWYLGLWQLSDKCVYVCCRKLCSYRVLQPFGWTPLLRCCLVCSAVTVECLYPCCVGVFCMFAVI